MSQHTMSKSTNHQRKIEHIDYRGGTNKQIYGTQYYVRCFGISIDNTVYVVPFLHCNVSFWSSVWSRLYVSLPLYYLVFMFTRLCVALSLGFLVCVCPCLHISPSLNFPVYPRVRIFLSPFPGLCIILSVSPSVYFPLSMFPWLCIALSLGFPALYFPLSMFPWLCISLSLGFPGSVFPCL